MNILFWGCLAGGISTLAMDKFAFFLIRRKMISLSGLQIVPPLLGRWVQGMLKGHGVVYKDIREQAAFPREMKVGWIAHGLIGSFLGGIFFLAMDNMSSVSGLEYFILGLAYGFLTNIFPWFLMYPAMGFGFLAHRMSMRKSLLIFSGLNHCVFGIALGVCGWLISNLISGV
jgi:hypothetical protein